MTRAVSAVVFDVGRVIVQWDLRCLFARLIDDERELEWFLANVVSEEWHARHDAGCGLAELVAERKRQFPGYDHLLDAYASRFCETIPGLVPGTAELIEQLARRGMPLYAITNFADAFWAEFRPTYAIFDHFRDIVVSGVEKVVKPDPAIFALAAERFRHAPEAMLFVDDNEVNVAAAHALGWQVHHFTDAGALEADLRERGLLG